MALMQVRSEALQAKQSMFVRHSASEKALREHKEQLAIAKEEAAAQKALNETLRANARNLRQQISSLKVGLLPSLTSAAVNSAGSLALTFRMPCRGPFRISRRGC